MGLKNNELALTNNKHGEVAGITRIICTRLYRICLLEI